MTAALSALPYVPYFATIPMLDLAQRLGLGDPLFRVEVFGLPGPQGSKSPKGVNPRTGHAVMVESSKKVKPWRAAVSRTARQAVGPHWEPLDGPLLAGMVFTVPKPASAPKRRQTWPDRYPDTSKLTRSTEDALTQARIYADDARLVHYIAQGKVYPNEGPDSLPAPGAVICLWRATPPED